MDCYASSGLGPEPSSNLVKTNKCCTVNSWRLNMRKPRRRVMWLENVEKRVASAATSQEWKAMNGNILSQISIEMKKQEITKN